jgi:hypothetical protein
MARKSIDHRGDVNVRVAINTGRAGQARSVARQHNVIKQGGRESMDEKRDPQEEPAQMSEEELENQSGEALPDREAMSLVNANLALPINAAVAANVLSDGSLAYADATQADDITQSTGTLPPPT